MRLITSKLPFVLAIQLVAATDTCTTDADCIGTNYSCDQLLSECLCDAGFGPIADNGNCADIDECAGTNDCDVNAVCANILPSGRSCTCKTGYVGDGVSTGTGCVDEDNCINTSATNSTGPTWSNCGPFANCVDKIGQVSDSK